MNRSVLKKFIGSEVDIRVYLDFDYKIDGDPQYNYSATINGIRVYDLHNKIDRITEAEFKELVKYGRDTGQYITSVNSYGMKNIKYLFIPSYKVMEVLKEDE